MSSEEPTFGGKDLAGSKFLTPSQMSEHEERLSEEALRRKQYSRWFSVAALSLLSLAALGCLGFSMWVGCHFLTGLDDTKEKEELAAIVQTISEPTPASQATAKKLVKSTNQTTKEEPKKSATESSKETLYVKIIAPLIPATFSSAIAIILFITIARLVTNFERMGRDGPDKDQTEDYGTIATFFQELGKFVKNFKS